MATTGLGSAIKRGVSWCAPGLVVVSGPTRLPAAVALTFDDGPHPENTQRILDTLAAHGLTASFFLQGSAAAKNPELVRNIFRAGHQLGNHSHSHEDAKKTSTQAYVSSVLRTQALLEDIVGEELPRVFRPPYGNVTAASFVALLRHRYKFVFWSLDSRDSFLTDATGLCRQIAAQRIPAGSVLLLHDDYRHTAEALPEIVAILKARGLHPMSVDDLLRR